jgi:hypothetical protein
MASEAYRMLNRAVLEVSITSFTISGVPDSRTRPSHSLQLELPEPFEYSRQLLRTMSKLLATEWLSEGKLLVECDVLEVLVNKKDESPQATIVFVSVPTLRMRFVDFSSCSAQQAMSNESLTIPWRCLEQCVSLASSAHALSHSGLTRFESGFQQPTISRHLLTFVPGCLT